ncbi:MAG: DUF3108 domain-containing protein [Aestuariivirga sp.]|nr:DUF3108 domain-containing protein [Aestuariivirga sp.]
MIAHRIVVCLGFVLSVPATGFGNALADSGGKVETSYEVNVRGLTVLDIKYSSEISAAGYRSQASIETRGVAAVFSDYRMKMAASGALVNGQSSPAQYQSRSAKKDKKKAVELNWSQGTVLASETATNPEIKAEIDAALAAGVTDPLTAIFRIGTLPGGNPCQAAHRIFDGKEVFELRFSFTKEAVLDDSFPGAYHGKAYECRATYVPVAGRYAAKFRKRNEEPPTYKVWLAPIGGDVAGESRLIPVRATGRLDGMKFEAYASRVKVDGRPFKTVSASGN